MSRWFRPAVIALCAAPMVLATSSALAGDPVFEMISDGKGKKELLTYRPSKGDKQQVSIRIDMNQKMDMDGFSLPEMQMPGMITTMEAEVLDVTPDGNFQTSFLVTGARAEGTAQTPAEIVSAVDTALKEMSNVRFVSTLTSAGVVVASTSELPDDATPEMRKAYADMSRSMDQLGSVLPTTPVGIGASWKVTQALENNGMKVDQVSTYTLQERRGDLATLAVTVQQNGAPQKLEAAGMPPGTQAELKSLTGTATGTIRLDLTRVAPLLSELESKTQFSMNVRAGGQQQTMSTDMTLKMRMTGE